jgi:hypothetical protein
MIPQYTPPMSLARSPQRPRYVVISSSEREAMETNELNYSFIHGKTHGA